MRRSHGHNGLHGSSEREPAADRPLLPRGLQTVSTRHGAGSKYRPFLMLDRVIVAHTGISPGFRDAIDRSAQQHPWEAHGLDQPTRFEALLRIRSAVRVVSLLPSATELLCAAGGADLLVGRSHECDWPKAILDRPVLTGQRVTATTSAEIDRDVRETLGGDAPASSLYTLDTDQLAALRPDLILTQDLCDVCSIDLATVRRVAAELEPAPAIVSLDATSLEDVLDDLLRIGDAIERPAPAHAAVVALREVYWSAVDHVNPFVHGPAVAFLEWMDPLFVGGHWTPQLIEAAGGRHELNPPGAKSHTITPEALVTASPDRLVICPCGYDLESIRRELPTLTEQRWWRALPAVVDRNVVMVDGNAMFNRPGPRLVEAFRWLVGWLNDRPELVPEGFPVETVPAH